MSFSHILIVFICHIKGANDPRVPESESEQIVKQIRQSGAPVWYILAKDEGTLSFIRVSTCLSIQLTCVSVERARFQEEKQH